MQTPTTWGDILTYCFPSFPPIVQSEEEHDPDDYVDLFPLPTRPTYVLHDSSMVPRILEGLTDYVREHNLTDTPLRPAVIIYIKEMITRTDSMYFTSHDGLRTHTAGNIVSILALLLTQAEPSLPLTGVCLQTSKMPHGGCDIKALIAHDPSKAWSIALNFERPDVLDFQLPDMLKTRRLEKGCLSNGSAIVMKMAAHSLYLTGESLHKRFGVLYSGDRFVFSELYRRPDGSVAIILSDCHSVGPGESQIPFIAVLAFLLLPCSVEKIKMPADDVISFPIPLADSTPDGGENSGLSNQLPEKILLSFDHPPISPESRTLLPCSFAASVIDGSPSTIKAPMLSFSDAAAMSTDSFFWDFYCLHVHPVLHTHDSRPAANTLTNVILKEPLRRTDYDMAWRGTATFADGSAKSIIVKLAYRRDFTSLAREVQIYETLATRAAVVAPSFYGSYVLKDYGSHGLEGYVAAMIILEDAGTRLKGYDGWETLSLKGLKSKQISEITRCLEGLHAAGFQHNDFTPRNVVINEEGDVRLIDFGRSVRHECPGRAKCWELHNYRELFKKLRPIKPRIRKKVLAESETAPANRDVGSLA